MLPLHRILPTNLRPHSKATVPLLRVITTKRASRATITVATAHILRNTRATELLRKDMTKAMDSKASMVSTTNMALLALLAAQEDLLMASAALDLL